MFLFAELKNATVCDCLKNQFFTNSSNIV